MNYGYIKEEDGKQLCIWCGVDLSELPPEANVAPHMFGECVKQNAPEKQVLEAAENALHETKQPLNSKLQSLPASAEEPGKLETMLESTAQGMNSMEKEQYIPAAQVEELKKHCADLEQEVAQLRKTLRGKTVVNHIIGFRRDMINFKQWMDHFYREIMLASMVVELILLAWIAWKA